MWLIWWYLESDFTTEDSQRNPFGAGLPVDGDKTGTGVPTKVPSLESLTEEQVAVENVDTQDEITYGEVKRKERIAILASEPSPAMTALKRARKEKGLVSGHGSSAYTPFDYRSDDDDRSDSHYNQRSSAIKSQHKWNQGSDHTRSPSPAAGRGFYGAVAKGDMRINNLLNDDGASEASPPRVEPVKKGPGRGNWRRNKPDAASSQPRLLPNNAAGANNLNFVNESPIPHSSYPNLAPQNGLNSSTSGAGGFRGDHVPTPSYQAQKRHRGVTQHQSAVISHRKQQIDYTLDRRIRKIHIRARDRREMEGSILRAWKMVRAIGIDYDSEEEGIKARKARERAERDDGEGLKKGKDGDAGGLDDGDGWRRPRLLMAGFAGEEDVGEEARSLARALRRVSRRMERWVEGEKFGDAIVRKREKGIRRSIPSRKRGEGNRRPTLIRQRSGTGRVSERGDLEPDDEDGVAELDEEDRELLGEVDADESGEDEDEDMADD